MKRLLLIGFLLAFLFVLPASAENTTDFQNFNETIGFDQNGVTGVLNLTTNFSVGEMIYQPIETVYTKPYIPSDIFWTFFILGIGFLVLSALIPEIEMMSAILSLAFISYDYANMAFIANIGIATFSVQNQSTPDVLNIIQPYSLVYILPGFTLLMQLFFWMTVLNFILALYHYWIGRSKRPTEFMGGT